jgi:hypothetical protein
MRMSSALSLNTIPTDHLVDSSCLTDVIVSGTQSSLKFFWPRHLATTTSLGVAKLLLTCTDYNFHKT